MSLLSNAQDWKRAYSIFTAMERTDRNKAIEIYGDLSRDPANANRFNHELLEQAINQATGLSAAYLEYEEIIQCDAALASVEGEG